MCMSCISTCSASCPMEPAAKYMYVLAYSCLTTHRESQHDAAVLNVASHCQARPCYSCENREVHFGWMFPICGEKSSELAEDDPLRKFKGRVVFQGNNVVNQSWETALFNDLGSSPAAMEGSRAADLFGCAPGNDIMQADAPGAYCQTEMLGTSRQRRAPPRGAT